MVARVEVPRAHRLTLSAAELVLLADASGLRLPPGFGIPDVEVGEDERRAAALALAGRGVVEVHPDDPLDCAPVPAVAANLATLVRPQVVVQVEVSVHGRGSRALYAVCGELGASVFALAEGAVELSMFPARSLGAELIRVVPVDRDLAPAETAASRALGGAGATGSPLSGRLPLAALLENGPSRGLIGTAGADHMAAPGLTAEQAELADRVSEQTVGVLRCVVSGPTADGVALGQIMWLATGHGWIALRPDPGPSGERMVVLQPVARDRIGVWLAPYLAQILEVAGE